MSKHELISAIERIDIEVLLSQNPRRPFDNYRTLELYRDEILKLINLYYRES